MPTTSCHCHLNSIVALASPSCLDVFLHHHHSPSLPPLNATKYTTIKCPHHHLHLMLPLLPTAATTTVAANATATNIVELTVVHCQRKRQQQHHHQCTNGSTNMKIITRPDNLDLFYLSTVFEVSDVGQGNFAIGKLLD
jgi:hypothetical protein